MRIALAQLNPLIGDLQGNAERILQAGTVAAAAGADLLLTPELSLWGYPPRDLLLRPLLVQQQEQVLQELSRALPAPLRALVGTVDPVPGCTTPGLWNAMALLYGGGGWQTVAHKQLLPSYDVFDETRYFIPGKSSVSLALEPGGYPLCQYPSNERERQGEIRSDRVLRLGITICEDLWVEDDLQEWRTIGNDAIQDLAAQGVDLLLNLSASPYGRGKLPLRRRLAARAAQRLQAVDGVIGCRGGCRHRPRVFAQRRRSRCRHRADGSRQRRRWQHSHSGCVLRSGRSKNFARTNFSCAIWRRSKFQRSLCSYSNPSRYSSVA